MKRKLKLDDLLLDVIIYSILIALVIVTIYPVWYVIIASFSTSSELARNPGLFIWPDKFVTGAYRLVFKNKMLMRGFRNTFEILALALPLNILMTLLCGYFMAMTNMMWKKPIVMMMMFTMFFGGGLIPTYLNVKSLGLNNSIWALIIPGVLSLYNAIICKTAIEGVPEGLLESAFIDGANDFVVICKILVPLIKPTLAVLTLYYGVGHWNSWFAATLYIKDTKLLPLQNIIRNIMLLNQSLGGEALDEYDSYAETIKYAAIVISTVPIMCLYPFLQKYFTKGVMIGAVKG